MFLVTWRPPGEYDATYRLGRFKTLKSNAQTLARSLRGMGCRDIKVHAVGDESEIEFDLLRRVQNDFDGFEAYPNNKLVEVDF